MSFLDRLHPSSRTPGDAEPNIAYFVARLGGEAEEWAVEYTRPEHVELMALTEQGVRALRARRIEEGSRALQRAESILRATSGTVSQEVHLLLGRWYYQALAYYFYAREDFAGADAALDHGEELVRRAIQGRPFLVPYAMRCYELWCHRLRLARAQRLWPELSRRVEITRRMVEGEGPLCVLDDGTAVDIAAVKAFYARFEDLDEREARPLRRVVNDESRRRHLLSVLSDVYAVPGFVIPYAPEPGLRAAAHP
jgi:hypothetical protein